MQLNQVLCVLGLALVVSLPAEGANKYDPSTIINVYPSLETLNKNKNKFVEEVPPPMDDCVEAACAAAASDTKTTWAEKEENDDMDMDAPEEPVFMDKLGKINKKTTNPLEKAPNDDKKWENKPQQWSSFQDMLQMLRKEKH